MGRKIKIKKGVISEGGWGSFQGTAKIWIWSEGLSLT